MSLDKKFLDAKYSAPLYTYTDLILKYSKNNDIAGGKWYTQKPDEIASFLYLPNRQFSSQFMLRQVEFNPINKSTTPVILNVSELGHFPVSSETNGNYSEMWRAFTFLNIFSNLLVWVYY